MLWYFTSHLPCPNLSPPLSSPTSLGWGYNSSILQMISLRMSYSFQAICIPLQHPPFLPHFLGNILKHLKLYWYYKCVTFVFIPRIQPRFVLNLPSFYALLRQLFYPLFWHYPSIPIYGWLCKGLKMYLQGFDYITYHLKAMSMVSRGPGRP